MKYVVVIDLDHPEFQTGCIASKMAALLSVIADSNAKGKANIALVRDGRDIAAGQLTEDK